MEIYELPITNEESRNYHQFLFKLKALQPVDWIKAYMVTVVYIVVICTVLTFFSESIMLVLWYKTGITFKLGVVAIMFMLSALQRSKSIQLRAMLQKYCINNMPQEFLDGHVQLKKIKVHRDRIVVYYRKFNE